MKTWRFIQVVWMCFLLVGVSTTITAAQSQLPPEQDPWDTYIDNEYGFSIQYPSGWRIEKSVPQIQAPHIRQIRIYFIGPDQATVAVDVWPASGYTHVLDWFNATQRSRIAESTIEGSYPTKTNAVLQSAPAIFFIQLPGEQVPLAYRMYVLAQQRVYLIHYSAFDHGAALETYQKMLESFTIHGQPSQYNEIPKMPSPANYGEIRQPGCAGNSIFACTAIYKQGCCGYPAGSNPFPCAREGSTDKGNCVWWAAHVWPELGQDIYHSPYRGCYSGGGANASEWLCIAQNEGYSTGHTQEVGAIFWPQPGTHGTGPEGHVAVVIQTGTSTFRVSEMNWCYTCYRENTYSYLATDMFIYHRIDSTAPTTSYSLSGAGGENGWYVSAVQVTLNASDNSGGSGVKLTQFRVDGGSWQTYGGPFTVSGEGSYTVYYQSQDNAGNWEAEKSVTFRLDTVAPAAPTQAAAGCAAQSNVWQNSCADPSFTFSGASDATSGIAGYQLYWGSDPNGTSDYWTGSAAFDPGAPGEGSYYFRARAKDNAGHWSGWVTLFTFRYDATAPTGAVTINQNASVTYATLVRLFPSGSDALSGLAEVRFRDAGGAWSNWVSLGTTLWQLPGPTGQTFSVEMQVRDRAGNESAVYADTIALNIYPARPASGGYRLTRSTWGAAAVERASARYRLTRSTWGAAAVERASARYRLLSTLGQPSLIGSLTSSSYRLTSGYWAGYRPWQRVYLPLVLRNR